jgi:hypothetical protein
MAALGGIIGSGGDLGTMEFQLQAAVESDPRIGQFRFTHSDFHFDPLQSPTLL